MARPVKRRRVCGLPPVGAFRPEGGPGGPVIEVTVDEYEAVRLIDLLGLTQEECAAQMNVARTTVQAIYDSAPGEAGPRAGGGQAPGRSRGALTTCAVRRSTAAAGAAAAGAGERAGAKTAA